MIKKIKAAAISSREALFQVALHLIVFIFYSFDKFHPHFESFKVLFFLNYAVAAFIINYFLLPHFYYRKKYLPFFGSVVLAIAVVILIEELVLEPVYFPGRRADTFPGLLFTLAQVLPVITILVGFKFAWDALGKQREVDALKIAVKESELQFLKSQINPHFLFNNLNNLYAYTIENSPKAPEIILELSSILRYMLYECREQYVPLTKEVEQMENFIKLNELQIEERGQVNFNAQNIRAGYQIAPLILIVFIENAFKHSMASQADDIFIEVGIQLSDAGTLEFACTNSFLPQSNTEALSQGIGLANVRKRLQLLYPDAHRLDIREGENRYEVRLSIELNKTAEL